MVKNETAAPPKAIAEQVNITMRKASVNEAEIACLAIKAAAEGNEPGIDMPPSLAAWPSTWPCCSWDKPDTTIELTM